MATRTGTSTRTSWDLTTTGPMRAAIPRTSRTLAMFEPTTLPTARSGLPSCTAWKVTASSGADVAKATTVRPTTRGDIPTAAAIPLAPRTRSSPPATRVTNPASSNPMVPSP